MLLKLPTNIFPFCNSIRILIFVPGGNVSLDSWPSWSHWVGKLCERSQTQLECFFLPFSPPTSPFSCLECGLEGQRCPSHLVLGREPYAKGGWAERWKEFGSWITPRSTVASLSCPTLGFLFSFFFSEKINPLCVEPLYLGSSNWQLNTTDKGWDSQVTQLWTNKLSSFPYLFHLPLANSVCFILQKKCQVQSLTP